MRLGVLHTEERGTSQDPGPSRVTGSDALLARLREEAGPVGGETTDQVVFSLIGDLIGGTIMPPANAAEFWTSAVMERAVVDGKGEVPARAADR